MIRTYEESDRYGGNAISFAKEHDWMHVTDHIIKIYSTTKI